VSLRITRLKLYDFRSYKSLELDLGERISIIAGPNAVGKTNIVEALQLLTAASSFRNPQWAECVRWGSSKALLRLEAEGLSRRLETSLSIQASGQRSYAVNGNPKRKISQVVGLLPCVVFTPDDLRLVKDSAERRRSAVDSAGDQLSQAYLSLRGEYERILRQRNAALKMVTPDEDVLEALTERLVERGKAFTLHRKRLFARLSQALSATYSTLAPGEELEAVYESSWIRRGIDEDGEEAFVEALGMTGAEERQRRTTVVGPHRDDIRFLLGGRDARTYASQGQQRTISLAWKLAEVSVITDVGGQQPLLLLDDVMSELDEARRLTLTSLVGEVAQTVVTTTNLGYFGQEIVNRAKVVNLS
jgi:DNA replication and repair protein RecF